MFFNFLGVILDLQKSYKDDMESSYTHFTLFPLMIILPNYCTFIKVNKLSLVQSVMEKEMATHSSILAWRTPWTEEPGGLQSTGLQRVRHD